MRVLEELENWGVDDGSEVLELGAARTTDGNSARREVTMLGPRAFLHREPVRILYRCLTLQARTLTPPALEWSSLCTSA